MTTRIRNMVFGQVSIEFLLLNLCLIVVLPLVTADIFITPTPETGMSDFVRLLIIFNLSWALIVLINGDADFYISNNFAKRLRYLLINTIFFIGITYMMGMMFSMNGDNRTILLGPIFLFFFLNLIFFRLPFSFYTRKYKTSFASNILVLGNDNQWKKEIDLTKKRRKKGYNVVGFLDDKEENNPSQLNILGKIKDLSSVLEERTVDEIFISLSSFSEKKIRKAIKIADYHGIRVKLIYDTPNFLNNSNFKPSTLDDLSVYQVRVTPLDSFRNLLVKKIFDFCFSLMVIVLLSPLFLIIALLISIEVRGFFLYCPLRKGEQGKTFRCFKFRTMKDCDNPVNGTKSTVKDDPRITYIGKFLRKYDLDELPQFINVLLGHMSVVGPRPHRVYLQNDFRKIVNDYMVRHYVKPGISGWAQVNGWRGPTHSDEQKKERIKHDLWYIENWSLWLDIKIVFLTVFGRKTRKNAF